MSVTSQVPHTGVGVWQPAPYNGPLASGAQSSLCTGTYSTSLAAGVFQGLTATAFHHEPPGESLRVGLLDRPSTPQAPPSLLFPVALDQVVPYVRFHLQVWRATRAESADEFWANLDASGNGRCGFLTFRTAAARREFRSWWARYRRRFHDEAPPERCFLPTLRPGPVRGCYVRHASLCDELMPDHMDGYEANLSLAQAMNDITPAWAWIVANARGRASRMWGGWLFERASDAALFALFDPWTPPFA